MVAALEAGIIILVSIALIQGFLRVGQEATAIFFILCAVALIIVHLASFYFRWQMTPAYLVAAILLLVLIFGAQTGSIIKFASISIAVLLLPLSFALSIGFPVKTLPEPEGPHAVGVAELNHEYAPGNQTVDNSRGNRKLHLKIWYPATLENKKKYARDTLWSDLHNSEQFSWVERFFTAYLKNIETHSFKAAPIASDRADRSVLIYNHALLSTASDNTLLMEFLASHGYLIVSIRHEDQRYEYASLQENLSEEEQARDLENFKRLGADIDRKARATLSLQTYQASKTLPVIVRRRALDTEYVIDNLNSILKTIPGCMNRTCVNEHKLGLVGLSLGGAVATEFCKRDQRCQAAVNLDGGIFGTNIQAPVTIPYLMLYSELNEGGNDFLKEASGQTYEEHTIKGAMHLDFHDATFTLPALRWFRLLGQIGGEEMTHQKNELVLKFLNDNL